MNQKSSIFLFDRREVLTLGLAMVVALLFAFTLGVHYGKRFGPKGPHGVTPVETTAVPASADKVPSRVDLIEQGRNAGTAADEELSKALEAEVKRTGIRLERPLPIELPDATKGPDGGATRLRNSGAAGAGGFVLQIGSFPEEGLARERLERLTGEGLKGTTRAVQVEGKGVWHRVILGPFPSREEAVKTGSRLKAGNLVDGFLVAPAGG